ncbi:MAG: CheB methylesterase [Steroidobacteraceae bacterium]|jgi:two-component system chemotaxis response regulator CheB|nr:CheB methylesterase [Steroidobacteraceae bacterium]
MTRRFDLVVIGGSAGAIEVLGKVLAGLTDRFSPAVAIVIHLPPEGPNVLHEVFATPGSPPMKPAEDKEPINPGTIYFAPPDYHLLVESGRTFALSQDDRLHFSRPAVDVLFESAAEAYGDRLMGVILSGANSDGAQGLRAVADAGGMAVVQALESAEMIAMPAAALEAVPDSIEVNVSALADLLRTHGVLNDR